MTNQNNHINQNRTMDILDDANDTNTFTLNNPPKNQNNNNNQNNYINHFSSDNNLQTHRQLK